MPRSINSCIWICTMMLTIDDNEGMWMFEAWGRTWQLRFVPRIRLANANGVSPRALPVRPADMFP